MFYAARAGLACVDQELAQSKTHATIIRRFSKHIVADGALNPELARIFRRAFEVRQDADYDGPGPTLERAGKVVESMDHFIAAPVDFIGIRSK